MTMANCPDCGHDHSPQFGGICIGCPCPARYDLPTGHEHAFPVVPPASMSRPGDCSCGLSWLDVQSAVELREVQ